MKLLAIHWAAALNVIGFSFAMVFALLILIVVVLAIFGKVINYSERTPQNKIQKKAGSSMSPENRNVDNLSLANDIAAISVALHLFYEEAHDEESNVITIKKVSRNYSPWSSKIYGITKR